MTRYYIGLGSNEEAELNCRGMIQALRDEFDQICVSSLIRTKAHGVSAPDYLNVVVCINTDLSSCALNHWCKKQEQRLGRVRGGDICRADMDILLEVSGGHEVSTKTIADVYYRPLVRQLIEYQSKRSVTLLDDVKPVVLDNGEQIGLLPRYIKVEELTA